MPFGAASVQATRGNQFADRSALASGRRDAAIHISYRTDGQADTFSIRLSRMKLYVARSTDKSGRQKREAKTTWPTIFSRVSPETGAPCATHSKSFLGHHIFRVDRLAVAG
jgi:hypothetical protein